MRVIEAVTIQQDLDPWLSLEALAVPPRHRKRERQGEVMPWHHQAIGYSGLSRRTLQDLINDPQDPLPSYRVGGKILVRRSEFDRWMSRRRNRKPLEAARLAAADARALLNARARK
jgi:excisionase family DNA binding protein